MADTPIIETADQITETAKKELKDWLDPWFHSVVEAASGVRQITSRDTSVTVRQPFGPVVDLSAPSGGGGIYKQTIVLAEDSATFDFSGWPTDFSCLIFDWYLVLTDTESEPGVGWMTFNNAAENDYLWNLSLQNQQGSQASLTDSYSDSFGAFGYVPYFADQNVWGVGSVRFPGYNFNRADYDDEGDGLPYVAEGTAALQAATPDVFDVGGYMQGPGPLTQVTFGSAPVSDSAGSQTFKAGSQISLLAY